MLGRIETEEGAMKRSLESPSATEMSLGELLYELFWQQHLARARFRLWVRRINGIPDETLITESLIKG